MSKSDNNAALAGSIMLIGGGFFLAISGLAGWNTFGIICGIIMSAGLIILMITGKSE